MRVHSGGTRLHRSVYRPDFLLHVVHQQVLAKRVRRGEVGFATAHFSDLLDEVDQVGIARQHEGVDQDSGLAAVGNLLQRLSNHVRIKPERVLVDAAVLLGQGRRLAVRDHDDLLHVFALPVQNPLSQIAVPRAYWCSKAPLARAPTG